MIDKKNIEDLDINYFMGNPRGGMSFKGIFIGTDNNNAKIILDTYTPNNRNFLILGTVGSGRKKEN